MRGGSDKIKYVKGEADQVIDDNKLELLVEVGGRDAHVLSTG